MKQLENVTPPGDAENIITIGEAQGYRGLQVHFGKVFDHAYERTTPALTTAYRLSPEQIADAIAGAPIIIQLINVTQHPPIIVAVGDIPPKTEPARWQVISRNERSVTVNGRHYFAMRCNPRKLWRIDEMSQANPNGARMIEAITREMTTDDLRHWLRQRNAT